MSEITFIEAKPADMLVMDGIEELIAEYGAECSIPALGTPKADREIYELYANAGVVRGVAAMVEDRIVGGVVVIFNRMPHYSKLVACVESLFLHPDYRRSSAGLRLIQEAKRLAREVGSPGLLISAPVGSRLERLMRAKGVKQTNSVFFEAV